MKKNAMRPATVWTEDVPCPGHSTGDVLILNRHSLISAGTESAAVIGTRRDMVAKAVGSASIRKDVADMLLQEGVIKTARRVQFEMSKWTPLGYSGAGVAITVGQDVTGIRAGDIVAYAGQSHAEWICSPKRLCVPVPDGVTTQEAAFVALGSIALQSVRRAEVQVGDVVAVLGLGLVGQLVAQLLRTAGARVIATDVLPARLTMAECAGVECALDAKSDVAKEVLRRTQGIGVDRVVICAAGGGKAVMDQAVRIARDRARLVVVGQCDIDVPRHEFYMKELDLVISRSYGPGRYDEQYERDGTDYPIGYVRWTEERNMEEFLRLIHRGQVDVRSLITHELPVDSASDGYDLILNRANDCLGVLLKYDANEDARDRVRPVLTGTRKGTVDKECIRLGIVGCGAFARQVHLPNIRDCKSARVYAIAASSPQNAKEMGLRYGASICATDADEIFRDANVDAVMVLTRDTSHAGLVERALAMGKSVFCEKPIATTVEECMRLRRMGPTSQAVCMVGFNRRLAPLLRRAKEVLDKCAGPRLVTYRVNAGRQPPRSWVYDPAHSGGRIIGEACHFVDLFRWLIGCEPKEVVARPLGRARPDVELDDISATFAFEDGSLATLVYTAAGSPRLGKERLEAFCDGTAIVMDDFRSLSIDGARSSIERARKIDKGHRAALANFLDAVRGIADPFVTLEDGVLATEWCLAILASARNGCS